MYINCRVKGTKGNVMTVLLSGTEGITYPDGTKDPISKIYWFHAPYVYDVGNGIRVKGVRFNGSSGVTTPYGNSTTGVSPVTLTPFGTQVDMYGHGNGPWPWSNFLTDTASAGVNATNLHFILIAGGGVPAKDITNTWQYAWSYQVIQQRTTGYTAGLYLADRYTGSELALPDPITTFSGSVRDFYVTGNQSAIVNGYRITVTDGLTSASIDIYCGFWW